VGNGLQTPYTTYCNKTSVQRLQKSFQQHLTETNNHLVHSWSCYKCKYLDFFHHSENHFGVLFNRLLSEVIWCNFTATRVIITLFGSTLLVLLCLVSRTVASSHLQRLMLICFFALRFQSRHQNKPIRYIFYCQFNM